MRLLYTIAVIALFSCQTNTKSSTKEADEKSIDSISLRNDVIEKELDTVVAKNWLTKSILDFFDGTNSDMQKITTPQYYEFKMDAMNVDLETEGSLSAVEFRNKWQDKYDLNIHPTQTGFLISGQDWGTIKIGHISVKNVNNSYKSITFSTLIRDKELEIDYNRDIIVVENESKYLIADVLEYD